MTLCRHLFVALILFVLAAIPAVAQPDELHAEVDRTRIGSGETLTLTLSYPGQIQEDPDFSSLEKNFEILSNQRQSQLSMSMGVMSSVTTWRLSLLPVRSGELLIPSLRVKQAVSNAIAITVEKNSRASASDKQLYTEMLIDNDSVFVQEQLILTLRLYTTVSLQDFQSTELEVPGARLIKISSTQFQKSIAGANYTVVETKFALFADQSGDLVIPPVRFSGTIPDPRNPYGNSFFSRGGKPVVVQTEQKTVAIKPRPSSATGKEWLPSKGVSLAEKWSNSTQQLTVGEPVTRTITFTAQGLAGAQLPPLPLPESAGLRTYADQPRIEDSVTADSVIGQRIESFALVPTQPGTLTIPPISVQWWDTSTDTWRETILKGDTFAVVAADTTAATDTSVTTPGESNHDPQQETVDAGTAIDSMTSITNAPASPLIWMLVISNGVFVLCSALFAVLWWRRRRDKITAPKNDPVTAPTERDLFTRIRTLANCGDLTTLRSAIVRWARINWAKPDLLTLQEIADLANDETLAQSFRELDASLYSDSSHSASQLQQLMQRLDSHRRKKAGQSIDNPFALQPLYPK